MIEAPKMYAVLLEQDSFFRKASLFRDLKEVIPELSESKFDEEFSKLTGDDTLLAFDVENDGLDGVYFDHEIHGQLSTDDLSVTFADVFFSIGPAFPIKLFPLRHETAEAAVNCGLKEAVRLLSLLPIDSSRWTGISPNFRFDDAARSKVVSLIHSARHQLAHASLTNAGHAKADAYLDCALRLTELPDAEPDLIAELIKRALIIMGLTGLMADLKSLFWN